MSPLINPMLWNNSHKEGLRFVLSVILKNAKPFTKSENSFYDFVLAWLNIEGVCDGFRAVA